MNLADFDLTRVTTNLMHPSEFEVKGAGLCGTERAAYIPTDKNVRLRKHHMNSALSRIDITASSTCSFTAIACGRRSHALLISN